MMLSRREILRGAIGAAVATACARSGGERGVLRIATMGNLTHAPALAGIESGRIAAALAPLRIEPRVLGAGPRVVEALFGNTIDIGVAGPAAIVAAHALHPSALTIVSGMCSGGASLVLARGKRLDDLAHATLASPQIGSTQDVSLRKFLRDHDLATTDRGGSVRVTQLAGSLAKVELARGTLTGAWLPEPWATRICVEAPAFRAIDERDLWPHGEFASAVVVARTDFLRERRADVARFVAAVDREIDRADRDACREALAKATHASWERATWSAAWDRIRFTSDSMREPITTFARDAYAMGVIREPVDIARLFT